MNRSICTLFYIVLAVFICNTDGTHVDQCNEGILPSEATINDCDMQPCIFVPGHSLNMTLKFISPRYLENIAPKVMVKAGNIPEFSYPFLNQDDACDGITNTPCPLAAGEYIEYFFSFALMSGIPPTAISLSISLVDKDRDRENVVCFKVAGQTVNP